MSGKVKLHLRLGEPSADSLDWYGNLPIHHAVTCDPPNIGKVKDLMQNYPSGVRTRNQFGRLPLHCAVDKICCNAQLVQILVDAYPEGASLEDDDGFSPLSCALRWEHSDKILRIILLENRYQYRGLYFAMRYGKIIGSILHCMECTFRKPKTQAMQPYSMSASDPCDDIIDAGQSESGDGASADGVEEEVRGPPALFISPATSLMGIDTGPSKSPKSGFAGGYPEIILKENPKLDREDSSQETLSPHGSKDIY